MNKTFSVGAEAIVNFSKNLAIKKRIKKGYRIRELDEKIRKIRTRSEAKLLEKASRVIDVPRVIKIDEQKKEIIMDFVPGKKLADILDKFEIEKQKKICKKIGESIAKLHNLDIIHGDLTTSNMIYVDDLEKIKWELGANKKTSKNFNGLTIGFWRGNMTKSISRQLISSEQSERNNFQTQWENKNNFKIFFIDFGLGFISHKVEDKAVDLHLFKEALEAKHFQHWKSLFESAISGYKISKNSKKVLTQLGKVESRGRYKEKY